MKQAKLNITLSLIQLFTLVINLCMCSSTMRFLPWFVEGAVRCYEIFLTAPLLLITGTVMTYHNTRKRHSILPIRQCISFITIIFFVSTFLLPSTDEIVITSLIFNFGMVVITIVFLLKDIAQLNKNRKYRIKKKRIRRHSFGERMK
ncbi:hypothetical protein [Bacillus mycoides]|uniref:hypothetical protein n=1 Tax=Bacillus mycoides TaxID=1405 RepID=UPI001C037384|nr:hypothetical protein [Bacillus mycoides]